MKLNVIILFIALSICLRAEDWTTTDGKTYKGVTVITHDAVTVTILDKDGGASVPLAKLSADLQKKFDYYPAKADAQIAQNSAEVNAAKDQQAMATKAAASLRRIVGTVQRVTADGFVIKNIMFPKVAHQDAGTEMVSRSVSTGDGFGRTDPPQPVHHDEVLARPQGIPDGPYFVYSSKPVGMGDQIDMDVYPAKDYIDGNAQTGGDIYTAVTPDLNKSSLATTH